jgi:hypothetical protein
VTLEIGMLPPLDFSAALNTTTVVSSTASVSIVTELTMTTTPHQTDDHKGTIKEVLSWHFSLKLELKFIYLKFVF